MQTVMHEQRIGKEGTEETGYNKGIKQPERQGITMSTRIWFNNWFNTAYFIIEHIRRNMDNAAFEIFGTNLNRYSAVLQACDYSFTEPAVKGDAYVEFCLDFCRAHNIEVFIPNRNMMLIAENREHFENTGTKVLLAADTETLKTVSDKARLYKTVKEAGLIRVPEFRTVTTADAFMEACRELEAMNLEVCFKPAVSEGGAGFRIIDSRSDSPESLFKTITPRISLDSAYRSLSANPSFPEMMVLEYLPGYEYSVDCLAWRDTMLAAVPRKKIDSRIRYLEEHPELRDSAERFRKFFSLTGLFNVQVKYSGAVPALIEVNPRMSAGIHISCLSGVNFPYLAIKLLMGGIVDVQKPAFSIAATQVEKDVILDDFEG